MFGFFSAGKKIVLLNQVKLVRKQTGERLESVILKLRSLLYKCVFLPEVCPTVGTFAEC